MADRSRVRETEKQIAAEIERQVKQQVEARVAADKKAKEVQAAARSFTPVRTGKAAASIKVEKRPDVNGMPARRVVAKAWYFHFIEFGTGSDTKQGSPFGPDTPTRAFAPMEKAANANGGTLDGASVLLEGDVE